MKVVFTDLVFENEQQLQLPGVELAVYPPVERPAGMIEVARDADVVMLRDQWGPMSRDIIEACPNLKLIVTRSAGFDHIDLEACRERGIAVCNVPDYGAHAIAEHALMLSVARNVCAANRRYREEKRFRDAGLSGVELYGKTLGVIGAGRIGRHSVRIGEGFGMRVLVFDTCISAEDGARMGLTCVPFSQLLNEADFITIHVPLTPETHHLINAETLSQTKRGAILVNASRGPVVDTDAVREAVKSGQLRGAGLDVLEDEHGTYHDFGDLPILVTPHIGWFTDEVRRRIVDISLDDVKAWLAGESLNRVI